MTTMNTITEQNTTESRNPDPGIKRKEVHPVRWMLKQVPVGIMAALFLLFGASKFYPFMPTPRVAPEAAAFLAALFSTGYIWPFVGLIEMVGGALLILPRTRLLGALLLLPVIAHIVPYLWVLARTVPGIPMGLFLLSVEAWILWSHKGQIKQALFPEEANAGAPR